MSIESELPGSEPASCPVSHDFNPFEGAYQLDPGASLRASRRDCPVFFSTQLGYYVVTRYEDVRAIFRDTEAFSASVVLEPITPLQEPAIRELVEGSFDPGQFLIDEDGPLHVQRRRAVAEPLTAASLDELELDVRRIINGHIDQFIQRGHADLVEELLWEYPATVALKFMGVPDGDAAIIKQHAVGHVVFTFGKPSAEEQVEVCAGMVRYGNFTDDLLTNLKQTPDAPGWVPYAIRASQREPQLIDDRFLRGMMLGGLSAAHETTSNASANAILTLLRDRKAWQEVCEDNSVVPNVVEECLRYASSVVAWRRLCIKPTTVAGVHIPEGAKMLLVIASANFDDTAFPNSEHFDIHRPNAKRHMAFGFGSHACAGAPLARLEMKIVLEELARRLPHMRLVEGQEFRYLPNTSFRGPTNLLVEWDPAQNPVLADRPTTGTGR